MDSVQKEIVEMKSDIKALEKEVQLLNNITARHDEQIASITRMLEDINDNTKWLKRAITGAIITAVCTGVIGGAIALFYANLPR
jgi:DNA-binding transcriptional regulator GbsR (MarR family)